MHHLTRLEHTRACNIVALIKLHKKLTHMQLATITGLRKQVVQRIMRNYSICFEKVGKVEKSKEIYWGVVEGAPIAKGTIKLESVWK